MNFDATNLYPSSMYDKNSVYRKIETGYAFKPKGMMNLMMISVMKLSIKMVRTQKI